MDLVFSISNFFINKISHANKWMRFTFTELLAHFFSKAASSMRLQKAKKNILALQGFLIIKWNGEQIFFVCFAYLATFCFSIV